MRSPRRTTIAHRSRGCRWQRTVAPRQYCHRRASASGLTRLIQGHKGQDKAKAHTRDMSVNKADFFFFFFPSAFDMATWISQCGTRLWRSQVLHIACSAVKEEKGEWSSPPLFSLSSFCSLFFFLTRTLQSTCRPLLPTVSRF